MDRSSLTPPLAAHQRTYGKKMIREENDKRKEERKKKSRNYAEHVTMFFKKDSAEGLGQHVSKHVFG